MRVNGAPSSQVSILDRGLHYGDGLFETIAVFDGHPCLWEPHCWRLLRGCERLGIPAPDLHLLRAEAREIIQEAGPGTPRAVLKILLTRGIGGRGYRPLVQPQPTRVLYLSPWPDHPQDAESEGVRVRLCNLRLAGNPWLAGIKHLNRLEQVLARMEWDDPGIFEGLLCDPQGHLVEGTSSNLFLWQGGALRTPDLGGCGVGGVAREAVIATAQALGVPVSIGRVSVADALGADLLLLSNSLIGLWPVRQLEERRYDPTSIPADLLAALRGRIFSP
jgi:4-amino-4-deoxychorismate lyase